MPLSVVGIFVLLVAVGVQYFVIFRSRATVAVAAVVLGAAAWIATRSSLRAVERMMRFRLGLLRGESGRFYREDGVNGEELAPASANAAPSRSDSAESASDAVNHWVVLTRECESSKAENAGCGCNPDGCARRPKRHFPKQRMAERRQKLPDPYKTVRCGKSL